MSHRHRVLPIALVASAMLLPWFSSVAKAQSVGVPFEMTNNMKTTILVSIAAPGRSPSVFQIDPGDTVRTTLSFKGPYRVQVTTKDEATRNALSVYDMGSIDLVAVARASNGPVDMQGEFRNGVRTNVRMDAYLSSGRRWSFNTLRRYSQTTR